MGYGFPVSSGHKAGKSQDEAYLTESQEHSQKDSVASILARSDYGYPWVETNESAFRLDEWDSQEEKTRETDLREPRKGTVPTALKRRLEAEADFDLFPGLTIPGERFRAACFGGTILGDASYDVTGYIKREEDSLVIYYKQDWHETTMIFRKDDFQDKEIPERLLVKLQASGGSGGSCGGTGGGSGSSWIGVIGLGDDCPRWEFALGKPGESVTEYLADGVAGTDATLIRKGKDSPLVLASVICYAGKGGIAGPQQGSKTGGAGGGQPKTTNRSNSLWTLRSSAGAKGGLAVAGTTASGDERQGGSFDSATTYLTTFKSAAAKPRNSIIEESFSGGWNGKFVEGKDHAYEGGGGGASSCGNGGKGGDCCKTDILRPQDGKAGGTGAGGGGAGYVAYIDDPKDNTSASGRGGIASLEIYY